MTFVIIMRKLFRGVAQMVARMVRDHEAASSSLATPTNRSILWDTPIFLFARSFNDTPTKNPPKSLILEDFLCKRYGQFDRFFIFLLNMDPVTFDKNSSAIFGIYMLFSFFGRKLSQNKIIQELISVPRFLSCPIEWKTPVYSRAHRIGYTAPGFCRALCNESKG